jgi:universal stress protein A
MVDFRRILCPVDFSETSRHALGYGVALAQKCGAELIVLHVVEDVPLLTAYAGVPEMELLETAEKSARAELAQLLAGLPAGGGAGQSDVVRGKSHKAILEYANKVRADLIVMGTHGRSGLDHAFFGSVTERVIRRAPCPVLIVRHPSVLGGAQAERK